MATKEQELEINRTHILSTLEYLHELHHTIEVEIQNEYVFGLDPVTGVLTEESRLRVFELEKQQLDTLRNIRRVEMEREILVDSPTPAYSFDKEEDTYDLDNTLAQYDKEFQDYLKEIQAAREQGLSNNKSHELTR